eukprot:gene10297-8220_t
MRSGLARLVAQALMKHADLPSDEVIQDILSSEVSSTGGACSKAHKLIVAGMPHLANGAGAPIDCGILAVRVFREKIAFKRPVPRSTTDWTSSPFETGPANVPSSTTDWEQVTSKLVQRTVAPFYHLTGQATLAMVSSEYCATLYHLMDSNHRNWFQRPVPVLPLDWKATIEIGPGTCQVLPLTGKATIEEIGQANLPRSTT